MPLSIREKVVVIAGANSGLGEALPRGLVREGAKVVVEQRRMRLRLIRPTNQ